jgi:hypothetical protein
MYMLEGFYPSDEYDSSRDEPAGLTYPQGRVGDIVGSKTLSLEEKRAVLASWASDARAVENAPSLRRLDDGTTLEIDLILDGLRQLDSSPRFTSVGNKRRSRDRASRLVRLWLARRRDDDDDDPPTAPATMPPPHPTPFVDAVALQPAA